MSTRSIGAWSYAGALVVALLLLQGCAGVIAVGAGAAVMSATDRRSTGAQVDDEGIELRVSNRVDERFGDKVHLNVTSFNYVVLLTGEAPDAITRAEIEKIARADTGVRSVANETAGCRRFFVWHAYQRLVHYIQGEVAVRGYGALQRQSRQGRNRVECGLPDGDRHRGRSGRRGADRAHHGGCFQGRQDFSILQAGRAAMQGA